MRKFLITVLAVCLLTTGAFAQTSVAPGGLVVFETFGSTLAVDTTQAGVLASIFGAPSAMWAGAVACGLMIFAVRIIHREVFTLEPDDYRDTDRKF